MAILVVAWWLSTQPPPRGERGAAPTPDQNAAFEPSIPVPAEPEAISENDADPANGDSSPNKTPRIEPVVEEAPSRSSTIVESPPATKKPEVSSTKKRDKDPLIIPNVTIKDQSGRVVYKGEIDLHPTMERITRGEKFPHRNDGSTFRNLEGRLPKKPAGYYTEYVHPTPKLNGPGPQRVVIGKNGEAFYTHDHYNSFRKVRE
jgi:guanyl-specific ribonuclease Sa